MLKTYLQSLIDAIVKYNTDGNLADIEIGNFRIECGSVILNGQTETTISFRKPFALDPVISVTAIDNPLLLNEYTVQDKSTVGFSIKGISHTPVRFDYVAVGRKSN